ncbi:MAG: CAP domain-containing protein [Chloroflexaceae bacterium]|nr:CAP domain-containing protein [Chloroflexaceae bacterium]
MAPEPPYQPGVCLTATEAELGRLINDYRAEQDLPPVALSLSLSHVAQVHVVDLHENRPDTGTDSRGMECNLHSWSDKGDWTPVCYTSDHRYAERMWIKPWEITKEVYSDNGFEIASKGASTAAEALDLWKQSPGHNNMIIEAGNWGEWQAMGVGFYEEYAVVWFGEQEDPQGTIPVCK